MEDGQADTGPDSMESLADFLVDNPEADAAEDQQTSEEAEEAGQSEESKTDDAPAEGEGEKPDPEDAEKQTSAKFKVTVKGEDGADQEVEVDQTELVAGYQRHQDYTRKTMALAERERDAVQMVSTKLEEGRNHYLQQAQLARQAITNLAGLRSPQEMAALAQSDPALWVQERERQDAVQGALQRLEQGMQHEQTIAQQQAQNQKQERYAKAWEALQKDGIDRPKLQKIFTTISDKYGIPPSSIANVDDPAVVRMMRDAAELQELKAKRAEVTKKVAEAPKLPPARRPTPKSEQVNKSLNAKFRTGKASLRDLGTWIDNIR